MGFVGVVGFLQHPSLSDQYRADLYFLIGFLALAFGQLQKFLHCQ
jgi:hypothetical protein